MRKFTFFLNFRLMNNNLPIYKDWMFFQVISALGAPRTLVDTVLESATHGGCNMPFPKFLSIWNNYKYCTILGLFSVLGAPRKVIDTVLESSTHGDQS